jgi:hypothetical protein
MSNTQKRRYLPIDKFPVYNDHYDRRMLQSDILNGGNQHVNAFTTLWDKTNIINALRVIKGDQDGAYDTADGTFASKMQLRKIKLKELEAKWQKYVKDQQDQGYGKPMHWPERLLNEKYETEAEYDVFLLEVEELERRLFNLVDPEKKKEGEVLQYGLKQETHMHGTRCVDTKLIGVLKDIDGQTVKKLSNGLLIINDDRSPYHGLSVPDYRVLANKWVAGRRKADAEKLKKLQQQAKEQGLPLPKNYATSAYSKVSRASLPPFPSGCRNWITEPPEDEKELHEHEVVTPSKRTSRAM